MPKKGHKWTDEQRKVRSEQYTGSSNPFYGKRHTKKTRSSISQFRKGVWNGYGFKKGHTPWNKDKKGIHLSPKTEFKKGMRLPYEAYRRGKNHPLWKGGVSTKKYKEEQLAKVAGRPRPKHCEVCGKEGRIFYDHDHKTGEFRGWLCSHCNFVIGQARDNAELLLLLADYLKQHAKSKLQEVPRDW